MRERLTTGEFGVMKGVFTVQIEEFGDGTLWNAKAADGIPATKEFDVDSMSDLVFLLVPIVTRVGTLVSFPDISEPIAGLFLLQNAKLADHAGETATGEAATGETKEV